MTDVDCAVSPAALREMADGIESVADGLRTLGPGGPEWEIERLAERPGDIGHAELNEAFVVFCRRWGWGVRAALRDDAELADGLRGAAADYERADEHGASLLARVAFDLVGDPAGAGDTWADVAAARWPDPHPPDVGALASSLGDAAGALVDGSWSVVIARALRGDTPPDPLDDLRPVAR